MALAWVGTSFAPPARAQDKTYRTSSYERSLERVLTATESRGSFLFHVRPGSEAQRRVDRVAATFETALADIRERLDIPVPGRITVFLYDTADERLGLGGPAGSRLGGPLHVDLGSLEPTDNILAALEPFWARANGEIGGVLEPGRPHQIRIVSKENSLTVEVDGTTLERVPLTTRKGDVVLNIEGGAVLVTEFKVRRDEGAPWQVPLESLPELPPEARSTYRLSRGELECVASGGSALATLATDLDAAEIECTVKMAPGTSFEVMLHTTTDAAGRVRFSSNGIGLLDGSLRRPRARRLTGPTPLLRKGLRAAFTLAREGEDVHAYARALLEAGKLPPLIKLRTGSSASRADARFANLAGGSLALWVLDRYGADKYRALHFSLLGDKTPLGPLSKLEAEWRTYLSDLSLAPGVVDQASRDLALAVRRGTFKKVDFQDTKAFKFSGLGNTRRQGSGLRWEGELGNLTKLWWVRPNLNFPNDVAIQTRVRLDDGSRAVITKVGSSKKRTSIELRGSTIRIMGAGGSAVASSPFSLQPDRSYEVLCVFRGEATAVYVDGKLACRAASGGAPGSGPCAVQIGGVGGVVESITYQVLP
jgi:hypothetical protein